MSRTHDVSTEPDLCPVRVHAPSRAKERGVLAVVALTAVMMVVEIVAGYLTGSMALLADGWHMATHVGALGLSAMAYAVARRFATHRAFAFGTGKVHALAGYTSAVVLGLVAVGMGVESVARLLHPSHIDYARSLPVAVVGLVVNVVSVRLLHTGEHGPHGHEAHSHEAHGHGHEAHGHGHEAHGHGHEAHGHGHGGHGHGGHGHDHSHRAALMHVIADTLTSALAIVALLAGLYLGVAWLDSVMGIVGAVVILKWGVDLCRSAAFELLDVNPSSVVEDGIREALEAMDDVRVRDLHVWTLGHGQRSCIVTLVSSSPREPSEYRYLLEPFQLAHTTIEVQRCPGAPLAEPSARASLDVHAT